MTKAPENFAVPLDDRVDALSDVLELIHLRGGGLSRTSGRTGTVVRHQPGERVLHLVEAGEVELVSEGVKARLVAGDLALVASGRQHRLTARGEALWISGRFSVEEHAAGSVLEALPAAITIRGDDPGLRWLSLSASLLTVEVTEPSPGSNVMVSRILDLLFIQALRAWVAVGGATGPGWLTAALDRPLGPAIKAMHRHPERPWTVEDLAAHAALSRAAFAARFVRMVGEPPARYLARIRLARAATVLRDTDEPVAAVGRSVGYASDAAFSRAFARQYGLPPRTWRASEDRERDQRAP